MDSTDRRKELRTRFMNELFEMAGASERNAVTTAEIAERLGLTFQRRHPDRGEVLDVAQYLEAEKLIEVLGNEARQVRLTHAGIREVEEAKNRPDEPTYHFAPINVVYAQGNITNSQMQQGSPGASQNLTLLGRDHQERLRTTVQELRNNLDEFGLGEPERAELEAEVRTLEAQADSPKPKREVVRPSLQSAKNILEGTASGVTAQGVVQGIGLLLSSI